MSWRPITEEEVQYKLKKDVDRMNQEQKCFWDMIAIVPEKWEQHPYGNEGKGFWSVALLGKIVVWYNDIEEGFNYSRYARYGVIDEYKSDQTELEFIIQRFLNALKN